MLSVGKKLQKSVALLGLIFVIFISLTPPIAHAQLGTSGLVDTPVPNAPANSGTEGDIGCSLFGRYDLCISNIFYFIGVGLGSSLAYLGAYVFDIAVQLSLNSLAYSINFIATSWEVVRDVANMAFLFILIYIALVIMLNADTSGTISLLAGVIVVALLVNFSFFFSRVVIDAGNILAVQFYNAIPGEPLNTNGSSISQTGFIPQAITGALGQGGGVKDLSGGIMNAIGVQTLLSPERFNSLTQDPKSWSQWLANLISLSFLYISLGAIFWILFIMFLAAGIKFLVRMVVLWFAIIASPIALVAHAIPQLKSRAYDPWQSMLIKHSLYPAFFLFIFWILYQITAAIAGCQTGTACTTNLISSATSSLGGIGTQSNFIGAVAVAVGNIGIRMGIIVAIMYIGFKASESLAVMGAETAKNISNKIGGGFLGGTARLAAGSVGFAGRSIGGRLGAASAKSAGLNDLANQKGAFGSLGRSLLNLSKKAGSATYDPRNAPGAGRVKSVLEKATGAAIPTGTAATKGFVESQKEASEKKEADRKERAKIIREASNKEALKRMQEDIENKRTHDNADVSRVRNMSKNEIGALKAEEIQKIAHVLNEDKLKSIQDNDKFTDEEKEKIRIVGEPIAKAQKTVSDQLRKLNDNLIKIDVPGVKDATTKGNTISVAIVGNMGKELKKTLDDLHTLHKVADPAEKLDIQADMTQIRNAIKSVRELGKQLDGVKAHNGLADKEFITY